MLAIRHATMVFSIVVVALGGCGQDRGPERVVVTGTVIYNGKPLPSGTIQFIPNITSAVPTSGAQISDGHYKTVKHGGVPIGTHRISIEAYRDFSTTAAKDTEGPPGMVNTQQYLPKKYNTASDLTIVTEHGSSTVTRNFDLTD